MNTSTANELGAGDQSVGPIRPGEVVAEKYLVERTLGVGGMGVVVLARDQTLDRQVAIKFLLPKLAGSETAVQRFVREARAATRITSEHVVRLLEIEKLPSGTPFFVMEYLEGCDLRTLLRDQGALSSSVAVDYALQALQAVAEGHVRGIVHRDIKPGNLFLTRRADGTPLIKVLDFGIDKTAESDAAESTSLTSSDDVRLGSPAYMPPEQLQNPRDVDLRSDIWSLGATLYELLSGRPPFEGPTYLDLATHVLTRAPRPLAEHTLPEKLPDGLERVVLKCLEKERDFRFANAAELANALARYGSADARMSLTRVSGMFASSSSFPALTRAIAADPAVCDPTLDVSSGSSAAAAARQHAVTQVANPDSHATNDIQGKRPRASTKPRIALAAVALLGAVAFFATRAPQPASTNAAALGPAPQLLVPSPHSAAPKPGSLTTPTPGTEASPAAPFSPGAASPAAPGSPSSLDAASPSPASSASLVAGTEASAHRRTNPRGPTPRAASSVAEAPSASVTSRASSSLPSEASRPPKPGRSEEIERLIENRR